MSLQANVRNVQLLEGQAFFDVAPDPLRPFVVTGGDHQITVSFLLPADHYIFGDFNRVSVAEVENLMAGDGSGRVQR